MTERRHSRRSRLLASLNSAQPDTRAVAFRALAAEPDPALIGALIHEARAGSIEAADALAAHGEPATHPLIRSLAKPRPTPFVAVLGRLGTDATGALLAALSHRNRQVRTLSAMALGYSDDPSVLRVLLDRIDDPALSAYIRRALIEGARHHRRQVPDDVFQQILSRLDAGGASEHLVEMTMLLTSSDDSRAAPLLISLLDDPAAWRWWDQGVMMLARLDHPAVEPTLIRVLRDPQRNLGSQMNAIRGLARQRSDRARPLLEQLAADPQERPTLPNHVPDPDALKRATQRSFTEQGAWKLKLMAQAALQHLNDPSRPMQPDYKLMQPLPPTRRELA